MNQTETPTPVVLILTHRQAEALASLITRSEMHDHWVRSVRTQLPRSLAELKYQRLSAAGSAFAAARAVVEHARVDIIAAREETPDVAQAAVSTAKSAVWAALAATEAAERERNRKTDDARAAAQELPHSAARTATTSEESAYATAERVVSDAARAAEIVSATIASGGDAEAALAALQVAR